MPKRTNPRLPSCLRYPSRRLHPLRELSSVPVETSPTPASSLESGTSFVGEALNFEGPIPKDHLTKEADSQGESVETARGLTSDPETEFDLRAPQRQAMEAVRKFISPPIFRKSSEEDAHQLMEHFEEHSTHNRWGDIGKRNNFEKYFDDAARSWLNCAKAPERKNGKSQTAGRYAIAAPLPWP
ncbi:Uncharacterized protein APZ42_025803 [Daphnia magna]|uniref:Uncharacterized protein n=1 Tax=Daphnia magna TaxID=35525 RepID=A0A164SRE8_9CRUS|nr:Uncharacterized protein APZ42_025803 [Daphnia magna]